MRELVAKPEYSSFDKYFGWQSMDSLVGVRGGDYAEHGTLDARVRTGIHLRSPVTTRGHQY
jgi:hypothetical protein